MQTILITGGTGFIGSHTAVALLAAGRDVVLYDNLVNSRREVIDRIARIAGRAPHFVEGDVRDRERLTQVLRETRSDGVIHFAALKAVGESVREALAYYDVNVGGTLALCQAMAAAEVRSLVFSSSATVYGDPASLPTRFAQGPGGTYVSTLKGSFGIRVETRTNESVTLPGLAGIQTRVAHPPAGSASPPAVPAPAPASSSTPAASPSASSGDRK